MNEGGRESFDSDSMLVTRLGSPIWGFTAHVGGRPLSRVHIWVLPHSLILAVSQLSACMCLHIVGPLQLASAVNVVVCYK